MNKADETYTAGIDSVTWRIRLEPIGAPASRSLSARFRRAIVAFMREWKR